MVENDNFDVFLRRLANAIILRALCDLKKDKDSYVFRTARNFCLGLSPAWSESLNLYCTIADVSEEMVKHKALEYIKNNKTRG